MGFLIGLFTVVMVLDCLVLILLVLIQLPKKEAGMGLAFGGAATDALFGAGSGNVLTKITKYAATTFFVLSVVLSLMQSYYHRRTTSAVRGKAPAVSPAAGYSGDGDPADHPDDRHSRRPPNRPQSPARNALTVTATSVEDTNLPLAIPPTPAPATPTNK